MSARPVKDEVTDQIVYEEPNDNDTSQMFQTDELETSSAETSSASKPKILVQRVFHQPEKHVVEQKLDYVIANSEEEITKHVYGGLFRNKYYKYSPDSYCQKHAPDLYEHQDETLVKLGDKFDSQESFRLYVDGNAKRWKYYLKCADSHRKDGKESFVFQCVFAKQRKKFSSSKGIRKRTFAVPKGDCPCRIILKPVPCGAKDYTVIYVCNHHDHPLTDEYFYKLQHGRRIHPSVNNELMDLLALEVDREIVKKYFESLTGYQMNYTYFQNMLTRMKKNKVERQFSLEKLKEMSKKIEKIKEELGMNDEEENVDNDLVPIENIKKDKASQVAEVFHILKSVSAPKKITQKPGTRRNIAEMVPMLTPARKRLKKNHLNDEQSMPSTPDVNNKSRLETRLQELKHDRETLQSIKHLQDSVRCETADNPWVIEDIVAESNNRTIDEAEVIQETVSQEESPINQVDIEPEAIVIENVPQEVAYVENQDIVYENEITVMDTSVENCSDSIVNCVNVVDNNDTYCVQYEDGEEVDQSSQQFVLILDDVESFENLPEVQIQATKFATVSIVSEDHQKNTEELQEDQNAMQVLQNSENANDVNEVPLQIADQIHVIDKSSYNETDKMDGSTVYEVIQTNDKKILPSKEIVNTVILNKPSKSSRLSNNHNVMDNSNKDKFHHKSKKTDVISEYFKEKSENYINEKFKKKFQDLADDECYIFVVKDEESDNNASDSMMDFKGCGFKKERSYRPSPKYTKISRDSVETDRFDIGNSETDIKPYDQVISRRKGIESSPADSLTFASEESKMESAYLDKIAQGEKELFELQKSLEDLKRQKIALEKDVDHLIATKDDLIEDITKAARLSRRMYK